MEKVLSQFLLGQGIKCTATKIPAYLANKLNQLGTVWLCALKMQWYMVNVQGASFDNKEASEALLHLPEDMELSPLLICGWVSSLLETRIKQASLVRDTWRSLAKEGCSSGSSISSCG